MRNTPKQAVGIVAAFAALSLPAMSGSPAAAAASSGDPAVMEDTDGPVEKALAVDDPLHDDLAEATLEFERMAGIEDPSAGR